MSNELPWWFSSLRLTLRDSRVITYVCFSLFTALLMSCSRPPPGRGAGEIESSSSAQVSFKVETVITNLTVPWSIVWAPDGRMFFTERPGRVRVYQDGKLKTEPVFQVPDVEQSGESGLMSVALHPQFATNHFIYLSYAYKGVDLRVKVVRYRETSSGLTDPITVIDQIPAARFHAGCRIRFGPDSKLYVTTGDATDGALAQRLDSLAGKTLRLNDDGSLPRDNPFVGQNGARPEIWSLGHRNSQGMDWQPGTTLMWQTEHGPSGFDGPGGGDEVNIVVRGGNYGWPTIHHEEKRDGMVSPVLEYTPACAPASATFYRSNVFKQFRGNLFFGCLRGTRIIRVVLDGQRVVSQESLLSEKYGRIREVAEGPDGNLYFSTSNRDGRGSPSEDDDRILRLIPAG